MPGAGSDNMFNFYKNNAGFTYVELLVAIFMLGIIVAAFTPLLTQSYKNIFQSGERSSSLFESKGEVEKRLAEKAVLEEGTIKAKFPDGVDVEIDGGIIEEKELTTFLGNVATMSLDPYETREGYPVTLKIDISGTNTSFDSSSNLYIRNNAGNNVTGASLNVESNTSAQLKLPSNLTNTDSPYKVIIETGKEIVRGQFIVHLPGAMLVGDNGVFVSDGTEEGLKSWIERSGSGQFTCLAWGRESFVIGGNNGDKKRLADERSWADVNGATNNNLNSIYRDILTRNFIAVGEEGAVIHSMDGSNWEKEEDVPEVIDISEINFKDLLVIEMDDSERLILVGEEDENGIIIYIEDEDNYGIIREIDDKEIPPLNAIAGNAGNLVAVGDEGLILTSDYGDKDNWEIMASGLTEDSLQDVSSKGDTFIAVGDNGIILISDEAEEWQKSTNNNSNWTNERLNAIAWSGSIFVSVGNNGALLYSADEGETWNSPGTGLSGDLHDIVFR